MDDSSCSTPSCEQPVAMSFLGTRLCRDHAVKANRRAAINVAAFGLAFGLPAVPLLAMNHPGQPLFVAGVVMGVLGALQLATALAFKLAADRLS